MMAPRWTGVLRASHARTSTVFVADGSLAGVHRSFAGMNGAWGFIPYGLESATNAPERPPWRFDDKDPHRSSTRF